MGTTGMKRLGVCSLLLYTAIGIGRAADDFPTRPLRIVVPLFAGAGTDIIARTFANALAQGLGHSIVVENKPGASTTLGTDFVAKSRPDGYTLLVATTSTLSVLPNVQKTPYDTLKDLAPVAAFSISPFVVVVSAESRYKTLGELIAAAKAQPGKLTFASSGTGTLTHMVVELLSVVAKINMLHVPYKGVTGAYTDVLGGRIDLVADAPASTGAQIKAGKFRALALTAPSAARCCPTCRPLPSSAWRMPRPISSPGCSPPPARRNRSSARLQAESLKIAGSTEFKDFLAQQGYEPLSSSGDDFAARIRDGLAKWANVVRERGIKVE